MLTMYFRLEKSYTFFDVVSDHKKVICYSNFHDKHDADREAALIDFCKWIDEKLGSNDGDSSQNSLAFTA